jgi:hypothetical protein
MIHAINATKMIATMPTTVLLMVVPIFPIGHHLPLVRNLVKKTEEPPVRVHIFLK